MITYYYRDIKNKRLKKPKKLLPGSWIHVVKPSEENLKFLVDELNLEEGHVKDALDMYEVPRLEIEGKYIYIYTRFPYGEGDNINTAPILLVVTPKFFITISPIETKFLDFFITGKTKFCTTQKTKLLLQFLLHINKSYNYFLHKISRKIRSIKVKLEKIKNKNIVQFVSFEGIVNDFRPTLVRTNAILNALLQGKHLALHENDKDLVEDIVLSNRQLIETADDSIRTIVNIREAYTTIMTNNLNRVIKLLTSVTVILTIPTMIASIYGMNVSLPYADRGWAFVAIILIMLLVTGLLLLTFIREDFL
ncbi:MAG: magnesium transporter CorA family protein [Candidatus Paceibacterota bacterium]